MIDGIVWLSMVFFLLLPYYHAVFTFNKKTVFYHVVLWLCVHFVFSVIFAIFEKSIWGVPLILFCAYAAYFLFSYVFYVRNMYSEQEKGNIQQILESKWFFIAEKILLAVSSFLLVVDIYVLVLQMKDCFELGYPYLIGVVVVSYGPLVFFVSRFFRNAPNRKKR